MSQREKLGGSQILLGAVLISFMLGCAGVMPSGLGPVAGVLGTCPVTPNCVTSHPTESSDAEHAIAPLQVVGDPIVAWNELVILIERTSSVQIVRNEDGYLHAEFTTMLMRFVDDVEFLQDRAKGTIEVRSASRLGRSDLGANRGRIEWLRSELSRAGVVAASDG